MTSVTLHLTGPYSSLKTISDGICYYVTVLSLHFCQSPNQVIFCLSNEMHFRLYISSVNFYTVLQTFFVHNENY